MKYYIATSLQNVSAHNKVRDALAAHGHEITYDWTVHGPVWGSGLLKLREVAQSEIAGVERADFVVVLLPGGRGTHVELGAAIALKKVCVIHSETFQPLAADPSTCAFYHFGRSLVRRTHGEDVAQAVLIALHDWNLLQ